MKIYMSPLGNWYRPEGFLSVHGSSIVKESDFYYSTNCTEASQEIKPAGGFAGFKVSTIDSTYRVKFIRKHEEEVLPEGHFQIEEEGFKRTYVKLVDSAIFSKTDFILVDDEKPNKSREKRTLTVQSGNEVSAVKSFIKGKYGYDAEAWRKVSETPITQGAIATVQTSELVAGSIHTSTLTNTCDPAVVEKPSPNIPFSLGDVKFLDDNQIVCPWDIAVSNEFGSSSETLKYAFTNQYASSNYGPRHYVTCAGGYGGWGCGDYTVGQIRKKLGGGDVARWMALHKPQPKRSLSTRKIEPLPLP